MSDPWISIVIPSYNRAPLLRRAIESVLTQTDTGWELLIVDDGSTDEAWTLAQTYADQYPKVRAERNAVNRGLAANFSYGATRGNAPYLLLLAADDQLDPAFLNVTRGVIEEDPSVGLVCGRRAQYLARSGRVRYYDVPLQGCWPPGTTVARALKNGNLYGLYSSVVVRRSALDEIGGIRSDNHWAGDFEAFVRVGARFPVAFTQRALVYQHIDETTQTTTLVRSGDWVGYEFQTLTRLLQDEGVVCHLTEADIAGAWQRIYALQWMAKGYRLLVARSHAGDFPIAMNDTQALKIHRWGIMSTIIRLLYHRWRLTY